LSRLLLAVCVAALAVPAAASARPTPVTWCGNDEVADNRVPDLEVSSAAQVRFVYAIPSDGADSFATYASGIATDAAWIDEWWQAQDPSRTPRFDRYPFPGCTSRAGSVDIGFVRLPHDTAYYRSPDIFRLLNTDLASTLSTTQKTILYYDGTVSDHNLCGQSPSNETLGGRFAVSYVYLQSDCGLTPPGTGTSAEVAAHELLHNLGALPIGAPHPCPGDLGHPCDSETDILYPYVGEASTLDEVTLDYGRDDYYGHSGSWWDTQDSEWLTHLPQVALTVATEGSGTVHARTDTQTLPCNTGCANLALDSDLKVTVIAIPSAGWRVAGWSGACSDVSLSCALTMTAPETVHVTFLRNPVLVAVRVSGRGRVTSAPRGIACTGACSHSFAPGAAVRLTASASRGFRFTGWSGACSGRGTCRLTADGGTVRARFVRR
jgi:hypothetical protein